MIPRGTLDIDWHDLLFALRACLWPANHTIAATAVEQIWSEQSDSLACLSVRSGFDLLLQVLAWPPGSEVIVSAVTIPDMVRILEHHGLVAVPIDIDSDTLGVNCTQLAAAITPRTKAILVAHLFGSRMDLSEVVRVAAAYNLLLLEDCAQAYEGPSYRGHPQSDVSLFSFGVIKTHTALGGAILRVRDGQLLAQMRQLQSRYPLQSRKAYLLRVLKLGSLMLLAVPPLFALLVRLCGWLGISHDELLSKVVRGFPGADLIGKLRQQPSAPLLMLLARRLRTGDPRSITRRVARAERLFAALPDLARPGRRAAIHTHWALPVLTENPAALARFLCDQGFDATQRASSMTVIKAGAGAPIFPLTQAERLLAQTLYLPVYRGMGDHDVDRLAQLLLRFQNQPVTNQIKSIISSNSTPIQEEQPWILQQ